MTLPPRFSGVSREKILLSLTTDMYWNLAKYAHPTKSVQELIREILEGYLSSKEKGMNK